MHEKLTASQLKKAMRGEVDTLIEDVVKAVNQAQPGRIIADSEELVRQASALFRQRLYERALQLRQQHSEAAFSPCARRRGHRYESKGCRSIEYLTVNGPVQISRRVYWNRQQRLRHSGGSVAGHEPESLQRGGSPVVLSGGGRQ